MDSDGVKNQLEILSRVTRGYGEIFVDYRNEFGLLDGQKWFEDFEFDYVLEVLLANFAIVNLTCERIMEMPRSLDSLEEESVDTETMPDYDMGYRLAEDCCEVISFALELSDVEVRSSLIDELFYAQVQYFNMSSTGNRHGWFDVNDRLLSSFVRLIQFQPSLMELLDDWSSQVQGFVDMFTESDDKVPNELQWRRKFIDRIYDILKDN